ncbi:hypothetical protein BDV37DRAFT_99768 [Aspergillus pseudonomiae]|uniref:BTB domain-containing protein n=1 Tax=Aspergillus pseudonomiae TaxID=1506151 RepID=A0A5N7DFL6_9EURO|nr:uncharacterized protein BDV37DRAFT_99768 [Aspergillus pseudonomiae]KAE8405222.1 hypothetical protein BDV37DRAFT_99768 [Aspergillus pseudonomiae]
MDYIIDPEGDMLLIVEECSGNLHLDLVQKEASTPETLPLESSSDVQAIDEPVLGPTQSQSELTLDHASSAGNSRQAAALAKSVMLKIRVSSKHLTLASSYFRQRLVPETVDHRPVEKDVVPACVEDVDALLIMLDVIHGQTRKVQRFITFKQLFMVAVLVEHYECVEAMEPFAQMWTENLKADIPSVYSEELVKWIGVAWIFQLEGLFKKTTRTAIRRCTGPISAVDVPIPLALIEEIEYSRQSTIDDIVDRLFRRINWELMPDTNLYCCNDCDAMVLGTLVRQLKVHELYPLPLPPFRGLSIDFMVQTLTTLPEPRCHELVHPICSKLSKCHLMPKAKDLVEKVDRQVQGLLLRNAHF